MANLGLSKARVPVAPYGRPGTELADSVIEACEVGGSVTFASALSVIVVLCSTTVLFVQKRIVDKRNYNMSLLRPPEIKQLTARFLATAFVGIVAFLGILPQITVVF